MGKFLKFVGLFIVLVLVAGCVVYFTPSIHKALFLWGMNGRVDGVSVEKVRFTLNGLQMEQFNLADQGMLVSAETAEVKASWLDIARSRKVVIDEILVRGLNADLATMATASGGGLGAWLDLFGEDETASDEPWKGILAKMNPSEIVSVKRIRLSGRVLMPDQQSVDLNFALDDLTLGETARIYLQGAYLDEGGTTPVDRGTYNFSFEIDQDAFGKIDNISGIVELQVVGEELNPAGQLDLNGNWKLARTASGETVTLLLTETGNPSPLIDSKLDMDIQKGELSGRLAVSLPGNLIPVSLLDLPPVVSTARLTTNGQVEWNYKTGSGQFDLQGAGELDQRPWEYSVSGNGTAGGMPAVTGFVKTGFADEAGPGKLTVNLDINTRGDSRVKVPILVERNSRISQVLVDTDVTSLKLNPFKIALTGDSIYLVDLQSVGKALAAWGYGMQQLDSGREEVPEESVPAGGSAIPWEGISGDATVGIRQLFLPKGQTLVGLKAEASVYPESISVQTFSARIEKGSIQARGSLVHQANNPSGFTLRAEGEVKDLPSDILDLGSGAPITGVWNGTVSALAQTQTIEELADAVQLTVDVEGSAGILQLARVNESANQKAQILNLGLALFGGQDGRLGAISQMTQYLQRVPYDSIRIQMDRFSTGQVSVRDFTIQGPELLLTGSGSVNASGWADLAEGALNMNLVMGTKGRFGENAMALGLTGQDLAGDYQLWRKPIDISGTLGDPDVSALTEIIVNALR